MPKKKIFLKTLSVLLVLCSLMSVILFTAGASAKENYDFSRPGSLNTVTLNSADVLQKILGEQLHEAERLYLINYGDFELKYDAGIPPSPIEANCINGTLSLKAPVYSYDAENGTKVNWIPREAVINGETKELLPEGDCYITAFDGISGDSGTAVVRIVYALDIEIDKDSANSLLNFAYTNAQTLEEDIEAKNREYEAALEEYKLAKEKYDEYVLILAKYQEDLSLYNEYVVAKRVYDLLLSKYNKYLAAKATYDAKLLAYNQYEEKLKQYNDDFQKYSEYLNEYRNYENKLAEYKASAASIEKCRAQLAIIDSTKTPITELKRTVFSNVCESTLVDTVLGQRDFYEKSGIYNVSSQALDLAEECTAILRRLLREYFTLETETAKYNYYAANYESFKYGFVGLFQSLYYLTNTNDSELMAHLKIALEVKGESMDRIPKLQILIAMLYTVSEAISDEPVKTIPKSYIEKNEPGYQQKTLTPSSFKCYYDSYTKIIGTAPYLTDTNSAKPISGGFPSLIVEPTPPVPVDEPKYPTYVQKPTEPAPVQNPGDAPVEVDNPGEPPEPVYEPTAPIPYTVSDEILALIAACKNGEIAEREDAFDSPAVITLQKTVDKLFATSEEVVVKKVKVSFHYSENQPPRVVEIDEGTLAVYDGPVPERAEDAEATYTFAGWRTKDGTNVDLSSPSEDLELYPYFEKTLKYYDITWIVDGEETTVKLPYGALPEYTGVPQKSQSNGKKYVFEGWTPEIVKVCANAEYTAVFTENDLIPKQPGIDTAFDGEDFVYKVISPLDDGVDISAALDMSLIETDVTIETSYAHVEIDALAVAQAKQAGVAKVVIALAENGTVSKTLEVRFYDSDNNEIENSLVPFSRSVGTDMLVRVTTRSLVAPADRIRVRYTDSEGVYRFADCEINGSEISFDAAPGVSYTVGVEYIASAVSTTSALITLSSDAFFAGDEVDVSAVIPEGRRLVKLVYRNGAGKEIKITDGKFTMPFADVAVMAVVEQITHRVTFISDGVIISTQRLPHGSVAAPPAEAPKKASDGEFTYTFVGWTPSFEPITEDIEYTAVYEKKPIEKVEVQQKITLYQIFQIAQAVVFTLLAIGAIWIVIVIIRRFKGC